MEPEAIEPTEARDMFLSEKKNEVAEATWEGYHYRLKHFVRWCEQNDIENLNNLTGRSIHRYRVWRREDGDLKKVSLRNQLVALRVFLKFCEKIDGVEQGLHDKVLLPKLSDGEDVNDVKIEAEKAEKIIGHLEKFEYASRRHTIFQVLWHTGMRMGALHSLDVSDYNSGEEYIEVQHRPETGTSLKNGANGERPVALSPKTCQILDDYVEHRRHEATDNHGRNPLFTSEQGRYDKSNIRQVTYQLTRPCFFGEDCPHNRDMDECEGTTNSKAYECPSSMSPHRIRRGSITHFRLKDVPEEVVSDRCNVSRDVLEKHYDARTESEKLEQRRKYLNNV
ncbi:tyrosine-type recombinase/integrase [Haladaptatus sp. F3-133]|uniref:Tyrosine-type recombinase/integrase n=1 Tax=Halorutilus salinus TaxID=2487751 RepID=A0A9Q4C609_9EURY|nr:tyrosine-type recombinase/integrase [Halorutilus salinus]MCX2819898.1 tyrosine-type recombinase/integrase [Halorutilus salinus]